MPTFGLRIAKVTYDHQQVELSKDGEKTIGELIDERIQESLASGALVSEVTLFFETVEQQEGLARLYHERGNASAADDGYSSTLAKPRKGTR